MSYSRGNVRGKYPRVNRGELSWGKCSTTVLRPASQRFVKHNCIYLRILIIFYSATFFGTNSLFVLMSVKQSINQSNSHTPPSLSADYNTYGFLVWWVESAKSLHVRSCHSVLIARKFLLTLEQLSDIFKVNRGGAKSPERYFFGNAGYRPPSLIYHLP